MFSESGRTEVIFADNLSGGGLELGNGLGSLRDSVLGKLSGKKKSDGGLDLTRRKGALLVVTR